MHDCKTGTGICPPACVMSDRPFSPRRCVESLPQQRRSLVISLGIRHITKMSQRLIGKVGRRLGPRLCAHLEGLAMLPRSRGAIRPRFARTLSLREQRAQGKPGVRCTRSRACSVESTRVSHHRFTGNIRLSPRNGFNDLFRALPGDRALLSPSPLRSLLLKNLTPASGCQDHTTSPSASASFVCALACADAATSTASRTQRS